MTLLAYGGFDFFTAAQATRVFTGSGSSISSMQTGRLGTGQAARLNSSVSNGAQLRMRIDWGSNEDQVTLGFGFRTSDIAGWNNNGLRMLELLDNGAFQCGLGVRNDGTGKLIFYHSGGSNQAALQNIANNVWAYIEVEVVIHNTNGSYTVKVDGATVIGPITGVNTRSGSANNYCNGFQFLGAVETLSSPTRDYDDYYVLNNAGGAPLNTFLGDIRCDALLPTGAGASTDFTPSAGANYQCVDDAVGANDDTDYVASATPGHVDTYAFANLTPALGTVYAVQVHLIARKDDAGERSIAPVVRPASADHVGTTRQTGTSYQRYSQIYELNPETSLPWSGSEVDGAEFGVTVIA